MTDDPMSDDSQSIITEPRMITPAEVTGLMTLMTNLLAEAKQDIIREVGTLVNTERRASDEKLSALRSDHNTLAQSVADHHEWHKLNDVRSDARVAPIRNIATFVRLYWFQIVFAGALIVALLGWYDATHHLTVP